MQTISQSNTIKEIQYNTRNTIQYKKYNTIQEIQYNNKKIINTSLYKNILCEKSCKKAYKKS